jgi:hypothetical protein
MPAIVTWEFGSLTVSGGGSAIARFCTVWDGQGRNFFVEEQYKRSAGENFKYHR